MTAQTSKRTAVQFGAGSVGRGFLGQLFCEAGLETIFIDTDVELIKALNSAHQYRLDIVGRASKTHNIQPVRAIHASDASNCTSAMVGASIACTAVGAKALDAAANTIAEGLQQRFRAHREPLNILVCENLPHADRTLYDAVKRRLPSELHTQLDSSVGFVRTVVARMTPVATTQERILDVAAIRTEAYKTLPIDKDAIVGSLPHIPGIVTVGNFQSEIDRKLFAHNGSHAVLGYLGWSAGHEYGWQALQSSQIASTVSGALHEVAAALEQEWHTPQDELSDYCADLLSRFANRELGDTCLRLCRDPQRKLAGDDRLVGAARLCIKHGVTPLNLACGIAAALTFLADSKHHDERLSQQQAVELLHSASGVLPHDPLTLLVLDQLEVLQTIRGSAQ